MKKHYLAWILVGSLTFTLACQPKTEESASTDTTEETAEEAPEKRPSPLVKKEGQIAGKTIKVQYGSPAVKGRTVWEISFPTMSFGEQVPTRLPSSI